MSKTTEHGGGADRQPKSWLTWRDWLRDIVRKLEPLGHEQESIWLDAYAADLKKWSTRNPTPPTRGDAQAEVARLRDAVTLAECPPGLFWHGKTLAFKSEYGNNEGRIDAYIVSSGEFFWGPSPQSIANQRELIVTPVDTDFADTILSPTSSAEPPPSSAGAGAPADATTLAAQGEPASSAAPSAEPQAAVPVGELREWLTEALGQSLSGSYDCWRVWEAWSVGTMRQDDFSPIEDRLDEIVDEVMDGLPKGRMFTRNELYEFERACSGRPKIAPPDSPIGQVIEAALAKGAEADV